MSFLAPLYILGALAISLPVLLHLIRRTPRGRQPFSSLMFLSPSPPRITRRSRIEHWLLLLLRAAAILLLALAFGRPFLRETERLMLDTGPGQRLAIVVDTSASMRREDLWTQALGRVERLMNGLGPADEVGLFTFDESVRSIVDWDEPLLDRGTRHARVRNGLNGVRPTWGGSNLGQALVTVADRLTAASAERRDGRPSNMIVITDMQHGSNTSALQAFEWPAEVMVQVEQVRPASQDNAAIRLLDEDEQPGWRLRVVNAAGSSAEQFRVQWAGGDAVSSPADAISVYVPAGQSRVVRMAAPPPGADRVELAGDAHDFDNAWYFAPVRRREIRVAYVGRDEPGDPHGLRYFLERVWTDTPHRTVVLEALAADDWNGISDPPPQLMVVASALPPATRESLRGYVRGGGTALLVVADAETAAAMVQLSEGVRHLVADVPVPPKPSAYALLSDIDFNHPVFALFAGPRYNDFTNVRFWKHQRFVIDDSAQAHLLARFDNGDPAMWEQPLGSGRLLWLACGWRPSDSQLALSSKFVPILSRVLDHMTGVEAGRSAGWRIQNPIWLPPGPDGTQPDRTQPDRTQPDRTQAVVTAPDGKLVTLAAGVEQFRDTSQPGVYRVQRGTSTAEFAVNLDPAESDTVALGGDHLDQLGVRVGRRPTQAEELQRQRQMRDTELESRQKLWRWLLVGVLGVLALETVFAGRLARHDESREKTS